jgi:small-conductance mechanosensitive channel
MKNFVFAAKRAVGLGIAVLVTCLPALPAFSREDAPATATPGKDTSPPQSIVTIDGRTLFTVKGRILSFSPEERAQAIAGRIKKIADSITSPLNSLGVVDGEASSDIVAGDIIIMSVSEADARLEGVARELLARQRLEQIREAIASYRQQRGAKQLMAGGLYSLGATALLVGLLLGIKVIFTRLRTRIDSLRGRWIRTIRIQKIELLPEERIVVSLQLSLKIFRLILTIALLNVYLTFVLSMFPWTRELAVTLTAYVMAPVSHFAHGFMAALPDIFFIAVAIAIAYLATKGVRFFFNELGKGTITLGGFQPDWAEATFKIVRFLIIAFCLVVIFPYLPGSDSPAFKGVSVFLGILLSLGSTSAVANVVSGVILTYTGAFKLGDRVKIAETVGDVLEKNLLVTRVRTNKNIDITIPNAMVLGSHVINYSSSAQTCGLILNTTVTIGYDAPWRKVHETLIAAAKATEEILSKPEPFVLQTALNDFYVSYELNAYTEKSHNMASIYSSLHQNIQDLFNQTGIEIMSPHFSALRDGNQCTIPADFLPRDYTPPSFRV